MINPIQSLFFSYTSRLTDYFPRLGSRLLDFPVRLAVGSRLASAFFAIQNRIKLNRARAFRRFLVHPDIHIGDAIMAQAAVSALRDFFPDAVVDFVGSRSVAPLIEGNPEIDRFFPIYSGGIFPSHSELEAARKLMREGEYDICINANPFVGGSRLARKALSTFDFISHAPTITRNERTTSEANHIIFQYHRFIHHLFEQVAEPRRRSRPGVSVGLSDCAFEEAARFIDRSDKLLVLFNADTASPYTRIPFDYQVQLITRLLRSDVLLLIGGGHTEVGLGTRLADTIPPALRKGIRLVPTDMSLEAYSALSDFCDLFITGDTGPMHIAAARKFSRTGKYAARNRTALLCAFGATPSRLSGYSSRQPGYLASNQDAPSWTAVAESPCRNITCVNKLLKTCRTVRCFEQFNVNQVLDWLMPYLKAK